MDHLAEVKKGARFEFGKNWTKFLTCLNEQIILNAQKSFLDMMGTTDLKGKTFLDIGCGSGIVSLVAKRLGAEVRSFDFDVNSVNCADALKEKFFLEDQGWLISEGSILDDAFISQLGKFDIVYSWGVLHHTGKMWDAIKNAASLCKENGLFFISIYNDQGWASRCWWWVKKLYNSVGPFAKQIIIAMCFLRLWGPSMIKDFLRLKPFENYLNYSKERGMQPLTDVIDWVGGYPFEVAKPEEIFDFLKHDFELVRLKTCAGRHGCNEFVFRRRLIK